MASACSRFIRRTALPPLKSAVKSNVRTPSLGVSIAAPASRVPLSSRPNCTAPNRRFSLLNRSPAELGCAQSLLPLHSAVAVARLTSCLSSKSSSCRSLSQVGSQLPLGLGKGIVVHLEAKEYYLLRQLLTPPWLRVLGGSGRMGRTELGLSVPR